MYCVIVIPSNSVADKVGFEQNEILLKSVYFNKEGEELERLSEEIFLRNEKSVSTEGCIATIIEEE